MATTFTPGRMGREERAGLVLAVVAHAALAAWFVLGPQTGGALPAAERMTVSLAEDVAPVSTAPDPVPAAAAAVAPVLGDALPEPAPAPVIRPAPNPLGVAPTIRATPQPASRASAQRSTPAKVTAPSAASKPAQKPGGSRLGADFLKGVGGDQSAAQGSPAAAVGTMSAASIGQAISRQIKPHWVAPQGADAEKLVTVIEFALSADGALSGRPRVISQAGITPANEAQKARHAEQAIRAVQLAAPFELPKQYYAQWRVVRTRFDRRLSQ